MDTRKALKKNTVLKFQNGSQYTILGELARGGTGIVYHAFYIDNLGQKKTVRIKECYPFKCRLKRGSAGAVVVPESEVSLFSDCKKKMIQAYRYASDFFNTDGLTNLTVNTYNIFEANNTIYVVSACSQGQELSYERYTSVKDSISAVKSVAVTIQKIHSKGYLYLDLKPSNILTLEGTTELIQLFDFDTIVSMSNIHKTDQKISYTKGFAAPEQQLGNDKRIGTHTDVYGIGALLFYMIFNRVPDAFACEADAEYNYADSRLAGADYSDDLIFRLTDFFHHTLANYYLDRYSNMETVVEKLSKLQALADSSARYVVNSKIRTAGCCLGREYENRWLTDYLGGKEKCIFVVGMGGMGKSTLVCSHIRQNEEKFDVVLYLNYRGTIERTILDDYMVQIHSVRKDQTESDTEYFERKLGILRELGKDKNCLLVIDNFDGDETCAMPWLLQLGWNLVFITRNRLLAEGYPTLEIGPIRNEAELLQLFVTNIGRNLNEAEREAAASIIRLLGGHTLTMELTAKLLGSPISGLTIEKAADMIAHSGFSHMTSDTVFYQKDSMLCHKTLQQMIADLFEADALSETQRTLLKALSWFDQTEISIEQFCIILDIGSRDDIRLLYHQGWIYIQDTMMTMHPVIAEMICSWRFSQNAEEAAKKVFSYLSGRLRTEWKKEWLALRDENILRLSMAVLEAGKKEQALYEAGFYRELLYDVIKRTPYENETYIKEKAQEYMAFPSAGHEARMLNVCEKLLNVMYEYGAYEEAKQKLKQVKTMIARKQSHYLWGLYYYMVGTCYDYLLSGAYDAITEEEKKILRHMLDAGNKAIRHFSRVDEEKSWRRLGECCRAQALLLIRSGRGNKLQIRALLKKVRILLDKYAQPNSRLERDYDMTLAWYYTYREADFKKASISMCRANDINEIISACALDYIDEQLSPMANIFLEWGEFELAEQYLLRSVAICNEHLEIAAYARRRIEVLEHLGQVLECAGRYEEELTEKRVSHPQVSGEQSKNRK